LVIPGLHELLSQLTYSVGWNNPDGLAALFIIGVLTDIGFPLLFTVEIFLLFASYYTGPFSVQVFLIVLMLLLGRSGGGSLLYWLSYTLGEPFLNRLEKRFPWLLRGATQIRARINHHTVQAVILVRLTPGFLQVPALITGSLRLKYLYFILGLAISSLIYDIGIVIFGDIGHLILGNARGELEDVFIIAIIVIIIAAWLILFIRYRHSFENKNTPKDCPDLKRH
jgi:membrane protein DedA with SNARE-associated domain